MSVLCLKESNFTWFWDGFILNSGYFCLIDRNPNTCKPSSVNVPVLSNTIIDTRPAMFTLGGAMQNIFDFFKREIATTVPTIIADGRAGGTVVTIKFKELSTNALGGSSISMLGLIEMMKPMMARKAITII